MEHKNNCPRDMADDALLRRILGEGESCCTNYGRRPVREQCDNNRRERMRCRCENDDVRERSGCAGRGETGCAEEKREKCGCERMRGRCENDGIRERSGCVGRGETGCAEDKREKCGCERMRGRCENDGIRERSGCVGRGETGCAEDKREKCGCERMSDERMYGRENERERECDEGCMTDKRLAGFPLAMVYSPDQEWKDMYCDEEALGKGTMFKELDLPFYPACRSCR